MCYNKSIYSNISTPAKNGLRLISINKASKLLGIRYQSVRKLVMSGKIGFMKIGKSIKIPYMNLVEFVEEQSFKRNPSDMNFGSTEEISQRIDELIARYSKANLN